jgi:SAM-dependent methyltransferase
MSDAQASDYYRGEQGRRYHETKRGIPDAAFPWVAEARARKIAPHVKATDTVFEYGVGWGWNLAALNCGRRIGYDVSDIVQEKLRERGIETVSSVALIAESSIDVILCHHTLEHLFDPAGALKEMRRMLKPTGKLLLFVPYEREARYTKFDASEPNHHLFSWNCQTLGNLVESCGFKVQTADVATFGYDRFSAALAVRLRMGQGGYKLIRRTVIALKPAFEVRLVAVR